jgi:hypothetical protein
MKKYTEGEKWLAGRENPMNPSTNKSPGGLAPICFYEALEKYTKTRVEGYRRADEIVVYDCMHAESINNVCNALLSNANTLYLL